MAANGPAEWYNSIPPITSVEGRSKAIWMCAVFCGLIRFIFTTCVMTTIAMEFQMINPYYLVLDWKLIFRKFQIWRLAANFFLLGGFSWPFVMKLILLHTYCTALEKGTYQFKIPDFVYMLLFGATVLLAISLALPIFGLNVLASPMLSMILYIWSRNFSSANVSIMGLFTVKGFYLPWAFALMHVLLGGSMVPDLAGIFAGHAYYFLKELNPNTQELMETPEFIHKFVGWAQLGPVSQQHQPAARPGGVFRGRGNRLGGN